MVADGLCVTGCKEFTAIAKDGYYPEAGGELELAVGDEVTILEVMEDGWWRGRVGNNVGVFPSKLVDAINELSPSGPSATSSDKVEQLTSMCVPVKMYKVILFFIIFLSKM